jgi:autotransporter translocation and assembly factor TamB
MSSAPLSKSQSQSKKSCLWLGLKWGALVALALVVGLVVFHRPLLRWGIDKAGRHFAGKAGLNVEWSIGGSVVSALEVRGLRLNGNDNRDKTTPTPTATGPVRKIEWQKLALAYDLPAFFSTGWSGVVSEISLHEAQIELDLRGGKPREPKDNKSGKGKKRGAPDFWLGRLDLRNVNLRIQKEGGDILVRGLTLLLDKGEVGDLQIEELVVPAARLHLHKVAGKTEVTGRAITLRNLALKPGVRVETLLVSLMELAEGRLPMVLDVRSGEGRLAMSGSLTGLGSKVGLDMALAIQGISDVEVADWTRLPQNQHWRVEHGALELRGFPAEPQSLALKLALDGRELEIAGQKIDQVLLAAESQDGAVEIHDFLGLALGNLVWLGGSAQLPAKWSEMKQTEVALDWKVSAPDLASFRPGTKVGGSAVGEGTLGLKEGRLSRADGVLRASPLQLPGVPAASLRAEVSTRGDLLTLKELRLWWDDQHEVMAGGTMQLAGDQKVAMKLRAALPQAGRFLPEDLQQKLGEPLSAEVTLSGKAGFALPDLKARDWSKLVADAQLNIAKVRWKTGTARNLELVLNCVEGQLNVTRLWLDLDEKNHLLMQGSAALDMKGPFKAKVVGELPELALLGPWLAMGRVPEVKSGSLQLDWEASGTLDRRELAGGGRVQLEGLELEGRKEVIALDLEASHAGMNAELSRLEASAGAWRATGSAKLTPEHLSIPGLSLFSGDLRLLQVTAEVPLVLDAQPRPALPLDFSKELRAEVEMDKLGLGELFDVLGMNAPVWGQVDGSLKVSGTAAQPVAKLDLQLTGLQAEVLQGKLEPAGLTLRADLEERRLALVTELDQKPLQKLRVEANMPLDLEAVSRNPGSLLDTPVEGRVVLPSSNLSVVRTLVPVLTRLDGTVMVDVKLGGPLRQPTWAGQVRADVSAAAVDGLEMNLKDIKVHLGFDQMLVKLEDVSAAVAGGEMRLSGQVDLTTPTDPAMDLRLQAKEALLMRDQTMSFRTDGNVTCQGTLSKAALAGRLELVRGRVFKEIEFLPLSLPNQLPPPPPVVTRSTRKLELPPLLKDWTFDLEVRTRDPIRLLGNVLSGGVVVQVTAKGTGAAPELDGRASLQNARLQLPFSRLNLTRGEVVFDKENPFDPQLDLQGDSFVNNYQVTLFAYGPALAPKVRFTSSPPLSEGAIATLLATGATEGDLRSSEGVAANRAAFLLISQTYRKMFRKAAPRRYQEEPPRLSFNFSPLSTGGSQRSVSATYELSPKVQAVGTISESGSFRGLLHYLVRFR